MVPHLNCVSTSTAAKLDGMDNKEWQARKEAATPRGASALQSFFARGPGLVLSSVDAAICSWSAGSYN
jgi:hypothetical protein